MYYNKLSDYLKKEYGEKLYKLLLTSGMTCPNRDGTCGTNGCIFCSEEGSGEFAADSKLSINEQIEFSKRTVPSVSGKYIAYFQSFTNTYASAERIKALYYPVVCRDDIAVLSIATRPDCLSDETISVLSELNRIKPVWVELGLQTIHEQSAQFIRRGYPLPVYENAAKLLKNAGIKVITHLILGLPFETKNDMLRSAEFAGRMSDGIKFHMLYIQKGTDIAKLYEKNTFRLLEKEEYIDILCDCIRLLPANVVIHRLTGDADKSKLIAPMWSADKIKLLKDINNAFYDRDICQGEHL
ncbi:MAG: TIGR01212 family radical SAM protein [Ruminococcus sp.]|nr:TIGR01212 family radical SAM protein [Ruminococcus sp.]